jgi:hypothetical protein
MKKIMAKESSKIAQGVASFEYNPADERYPTLFELNRPLEQLQGILLSEYTGRTVTFLELYEKHSVGRPYVDSNYKAVLKEMEKEGKVSAIKPGTAKRRPWTFANDVLITFAEGG